ncbi:MAG: PTS-dependent dihydroxyacetone kinase phosphotransferase subunit DhaM [Caldilineaceae bacterium]|nr:PTS-dependent dihydroxyacetone kinase phosphotransferase subunit DhaM [Caldilineaceae bacterium]
MVNLVIVSHCHALANGAKELAEQMTGNAIRIAAVGGLATNDGYVLGTNAIAISEAVANVWDPSGVLLLVDLGSAILSAELALELLDPEMQKCCLISNAPLVEGAVVAALEASVGHSLDVVNQAAESACQFPKVSR